MFCCAKKCFALHSKVLHSLVKFLHYVLITCTTLLSQDIIVNLISLGCVALHICILCKIQNMSLFHVWCCAKVGLAVAKRRHNFCNSCISTALQAGGCGDAFGKWDKVEARSKLCLAGSRWARKLLLPSCDTQFCNFIAPLQCLVNG